MSFSLHDTIDKLEAYNDSQAPILSVYFHLPEKGNILEKFNDMINDQLSANQIDEVTNNLSYIQGFLENYHNKHHDETLAFFSGGNNLFEVIHLPYAITNLAVVNHSPFLTPLLAAQAEYRRFLAIFVDREKAIMFSVIDNTVEDKTEVIDKTVPQNVHQNAEEVPRSQRSDKTNRHIEQHIDRHFQTLARKTEEFIQGKPILGIVIGGHKNIMHKFIKQLPSWMQKRIVGEISSELNTNFNILVENANKIIANANGKFTFEQPAFRNI